MEIVSKKTAIKAYEKGFNKPCQFYFWSDNQMIKHTCQSEKDGYLCRQREWEDINEYNKKIYTIAVPTLYQLQQWLREKYDIHIWIKPNKNGIYIPYYLINDFNKIKSNYIPKLKPGINYEKVLDKILYELLNVIAI